MCELHFLIVTVCRHCALAANIAGYTRLCANIDIFSNVMHYSLFNYCNPR